jgi:hypothetical protein
VEVGGVTVSCAEALAACDVLASARTTAIRSVLAAAGHPLAACDYHAVYRPGLELARRQLGSAARPGAAGRPAARHAFALRVRQLVAAAACRALEQALEAIATDERYATAIARDGAALAARQGRPRASVVVRDSDSASCLDAAA